MPALWNAVPGIIPVHCRLSFNVTAHQAPQSPSHTLHYKVLSAPCSWINPHYTELPIRQNRNNLSPQLGQGRCHKRSLTAPTGAPSLSSHGITLFYSVLLMHAALFNFIIQQEQGPTSETAPLCSTPYLGGAKDLQSLPDASHTATDVKRLQKTQPISDGFHKTSVCVSPETQQTFSKWILRGEKVTMVPKKISW